MSVVVVGAGPSGLVLANVLAGLGAPVRIVDRKPGPVRESRAAIVHVRTLELLDRIGIKQQALACGVPVGRVEVHQRGRPAAEVSLAVGAGATPLVLTQDRLERLLVDALAGRGVAVQWRTEVVSVDGSAVVLDGPGGRERVTARWIVGADGASSRVRHALGLDFAGKTYQQSGLLADVRLDPPPQRGVLRLNLTRGGFVGMLDLGNGYCRLFGALPPGLGGSGGGDVSHEPYTSVGRTDLQRWFDELFAVRAHLTEVTWAALFRTHSRMTERFRVGDAFLVGDAAHIHSPAGGQGMNLGIGDAVNLGWKLGLVAAGRAHERLLDSYEAERMPVARSVLRGADRGFALEATNSLVGTWLRDHLGTRLVRPVLGLPAVRSQVAGLFSQTWIRYPDSPIVAGPHAGDRVAPEVVPADLSHHVLTADEPTVSAMLAGRGLDVCIHAQPVTASEVQLIRPDGHLGFAGPAMALPAYLDLAYGAAPTGHVP